MSNSTLIFQVALMLAKLYGLSCGEALRYTQAFHDARRYPQNVRSPQTAIQRTQVRRLLSADLPLPQPITKGQGLVNKGHDIVGKGQGLVGSLASGATAGLLASAAPCSVAAAVTRTTGVLRRSASDDPFRYLLIPGRSACDCKKCLTDQHSCRLVNHHCFAML